MQEYCKVYDDHWTAFTVFRNEVHLLFHSFGTMREFPECLWARRAKSPTLGLSCPTQNNCMTLTYRYSFVDVLHRFWSFWLPPVCGSWRKGVVLYCCSLFVTQRVIGKDDIFPYATEEEMGEDTSPCWFGPPASSSSLMVVHLLSDHLV